MRSPNSVVPALLALSAVLLCSGCGQKGPLTLPAATPAAASGAASGATR